MRQQRGAIGPLFEENQPQRVLAIDLDRMRDAAGLAARAVNVLKTEPSHLVESFQPCDDAAGDDDHVSPRFYSAGAAACERLSFCCGQRFSAARPASVRT